jgi:DNA-binding response OmpR family regulator
MTARRLRVESHGDGEARVIDCETGQALADVTVVGVKVDGAGCAVLLQLAATEVSLMLTPRAAPQQPAANVDRLAAPAAKKTCKTKDKNPKAAQATPRSEPPRAPAAAGQADRRPDVPGEIVEAHGVRVDVAAGTVSFGDKSEKLSPRECSLARVLVKAMPNVMTRADLVNRAWQMRALDSDANAVLYTYAGTLRAKLAGIGLELNTVPKFGYALAIAGG